LASNITFSKRLLIASAATLAVVFGITFSSLYSLSQVGGELEKSTGPNAEKIALVGELKATANLMRTGQRGLLLNLVQNDAKGSEKTRAEYQMRHGEARALLKKLNALLVSGKERELARALDAAVETHVSCFERLRQLCAAGKTPEAFAMYKDRGAPAGVAMEKTASQLMEHEKTFMKLSAAFGAQKLQIARWIAIVMNVIAIVMAGIMTLTVLGATRTLRAVAAKLGESAAEIASATLQVSSISQSLADGASQQAASLEETSASASQLASMTHRNAESSKTAADVMATVDAQVRDGNQAVDEMVASMREITSSSKKISAFMKVIDEIAFQTNILALNAAVEAARAGVAGAGFAVVADEVRNLAQRSAQAARDTSDLIAESIGRSNDGGVRLQHVAEVIRSITASAARVKLLVDQVNVGSGEQASGIDGISKAVLLVEQVTQSTAASAEQSAAASEEMAAQADGLKEIVGQLQTMVGA
jgi:methyl-accepting chemotaxis protein